MLVNEVHISGRLATEPQQAGKSPTKFRIAHGGGGKKKDGTIYAPMFFTVSVWDKKLAQGLQRGQQVEVFGKLHHSV